jgi:hypothetical protein
MNDDRSIRQNIAWLRETGAVIRATPALWRRWWLVLRACEAEADRLERIIAHRLDAPADAIGAEAVDLAEWRRRRGAARRRHERRSGGMA